MNKLLISLGVILLGLIAIFGKPQPKTIPVVQQVKTEVSQTLELRYTAQVFPQGEGVYRIDFYLSGNPNAKADAADLTLEAGENTYFLGGSKGLTFAQYPRFEVTSQRATITGLAQFNSAKSIQPGQVNKLFASLEVKKNNPQDQATLLVDADGTKAYYLGNSVLNKAANLKDLVF